MYIELGIDTLIFHGILRITMSSGTEPPGRIRAADCGVDNYRKLPKATMVVFGSFR